MSTLDAWSCLTQSRGSSWFEYCVWTGDVCWLSAENVTTEAEWLHCIDALLSIANALFLAGGKGIIGYLSGCLCVVLAEVRVK